MWQKIKSWLLALLAFGLACWAIVRWRAARQAEQIARANAAGYLHGATIEGASKAKEHRRAAELHHERADQARASAERQIAELTARGAMKLAALAARWNGGDA